jgi:hypothetical protein
MKAAGHKNFETTMNYVRDAEQVSADFGDVFPSPGFAAWSRRIDPGIAPESWRRL